MNHLFKTLLFTGALLSSQTMLIAQECGTQATPEQIEYLSQTREARQAFDMSQRADDRYGAGIHWVPMQFHECLNSAG
ncbi:MAG: hypothetical protein SFV22_01190, partial [Saprospiraceae bacterium]|nr:hypothetical protein [Saprospiraceae bacterium]